MGQHYIERYIPIQEAVARLQKSDRQVRRMAHEGKLRYRHTSSNRLEIALSDIDRLTSRPLATGDAERIDNIEREIETLRQEIDALSTRMDDLLRTQQKPTPRPLQPQKQASETDPLPEGWVAVADLIKEHNAPETSVMRKLRPYFKTGPWKTRDGRTIQYALDQEGHTEFIKRYGNKQA